MARQKNPAPLRREPSQEVYESEAARQRRRRPGKVNGSAVAAVGEAQTGGGKGAVEKEKAKKKEAGVLELVFCVGGIYASFLSWAYLQERITTTPFASPTTPGATEKWRYPLVLNTLQSAFAAVTGTAYLVLSSLSSSSSGLGPRVPSPFPSASILPPLLLVAVVSSLASPFGYASLAHIDYVTFILAKSCKLVPVLLLHVTLFRRRYPLYKYGVVAAVTAGVALFTLHHPSTAKKAARAAGKRADAGAGAEVGSPAWGLALLAVNLLFDGLTNATQDHVFRAHPAYSAPQMMVAQNALATLLTGGYLALATYALPALPRLSGLLAFALPPAAASAAAAELPAAAALLRANAATLLPAVLGFAACGAVGQVFIFATLSRFGSLLLVTVTVTRKMLTMVVSVLAFGHAVAGWQWVGVGLVFGGVGGEAWMGRREKVRRKRKAEAEKAGKGE